MMAAEYVTLALRSLKAMERLPLKALIFGLSRYNGESLAT